MPGGYNGKGRVILFANNPIYRWQNHGEFNMVFNAMLNWNDLGKAGSPSRRPRRQESQGLDSISNAEWHLASGHPTDSVSRRSL